MLPKPVESAVIERHLAKNFRVGVAEVNGWRNNMEDAHLIHICSDWAFFAVYDGHGGDQCSAFVADKVRKHLASHGCPQDDAAFKKMVLGVDQEFLDTKQESGSTGTMVIVHRPTSGCNKFRLRLGNVGDSRVLLGRRDGTIYDGSGTDQGLTTDHKPELPSERERIYRCGGHVGAGQMGGPARVNGELSVSRCFGDASHKETGGPGPEDHPVTADPELGYAECGESDFLLLVCDGISEGDFPNAAVVKMVATHLKNGDDVGVAARAVCTKAIEANSKDNVTCMVVMLDGSGLDKIDKSVEFIPGELSAPTNKAFMTAWEGMAKRGGMTLAQAAEMRYEFVMESLAGHGLSPLQQKEMRAEVEGLGTPGGLKGSRERSAWFRIWEEKLPENMVADDSEAEMMRLLMARRRLDEGPGAGMYHPGERQCIRRVRVPEVATLRRAVNDSDSLEWDQRMSQLAGAEGQVQQDDKSDGTSQVWVASASMTAWLPTSVLADLDEGGGGGAAAKGRPRGITPALTTAAPRSSLMSGLTAQPRLEANSRQGASPPDVVPPAAGRRRAPRPDAGAPAGPRGSSPSTPSSTASNALSASGRLKVAPRLPAMQASGGPAGYRPPSPGVAAAGARGATGRFRAPSPIDCAVGNRTRGSAAAVAGRISRSMPPRPHM